METDGHNKSPTTMWHTHATMCSDGVERPFLLKLPPNYDPCQSYPLLINLHGGVRRSSLEVESRPAKIDPFWGWGVDEGLYILLVPVTNGIAPWWTEAGADVIFSALARTLQLVNVDENKVFCMGFSDGAGGAFYMALNHPTAFAGFICVNGALSAASNGGDTIYPVNLRNRPLYVMNGGSDRIFEPYWVEKDVRAMQKAGLRCFNLRRDIGLSQDELEPDPEFANHAGPKLSFHLWNDCGHVPPVYLDRERDSLRDFLSRTVRSPFPEEIFWETDSPARGRCDWLRINTIDPDWQGQPRLMSFADEAASSVAVQPSQWKCSGRIRAKRQGNTIQVQSDGVSSFTILLSPEMVDFSRPIEVDTNGELSFHVIQPLPPGSRAELTNLQSFGPVFEGHVTISVPPVGVCLS